MTTDTDTRTQHTPGPWLDRPTAGHEVHGQAAVHAELTGETIAIVYNGAADARLIAAAPALLAALEDIEAQARVISEDASDDDDLAPPTWSDYYDALREVASKARATIATVYRRDDARLIAAAPALLAALEAIIDTIDEPSGADVLRHVEYLAGAAIAAARGDA